MKQTVINIFLFIFFPIIIFSQEQKNCLATCFLVYENEEIELSDTNKYCIDKYIENYFLPYNLDNQYVILSYGCTTELEAVKGMKRAFYVVEYLRKKYSSLKNKKIMIIDTPKPILIEKNGKEIGIIMVVRQIDFY